jgi:hypothetical protein
VMGTMAENYIRWMRRQLLGCLTAVILIRAFAVQGLFDNLPDFTRRTSVIFFIIQPHVAGSTISSESSICRARPGRSANSLSFSLRVVLGLFIAYSCKLSIKSFFPFAFNPCILYSETSWFPFSEFSAAKFNRMLG